MSTIERLGGESAAGASVALVLPGAGYTVQAPLLNWPVLALKRAGWDVWTINWHADINESVQRDIPGFVNAALAQAATELPDAPKLVIGKSLGTYALPYFVDRNVRAAWLTPILTVPEIADALRSASEQHLAVGGTSDPSWRPETVENTRARIISVPSANHSLERPDAGWRDSAVNQLDVSDQVIAHLLAAR